MGYLGVTTFAAMPHRPRARPSVHQLLILSMLAAPVALAQPGATKQPKGHPAPQRPVSPASDAVVEAQTPRDVPDSRPEQKKSAHDHSDVFAATKAQPSSPAFAGQPEQGKTLGFELYRDPLDAKRPMESPDAITRADIAAKSGVMAAQRRLLDSRYDLEPQRFDVDFDLPEAFIPEFPPAIFLQNRPDR